MSNIQIQDNAQYYKCNKCNGSGRIFDEHYTSSEEPYTSCDDCYGTGKYKEEHYYLIDNKNKIAFDIDFMGK